MLANRMRMSTGSNLPFEISWIDSASDATNGTSFDFGNWTASSPGLLIAGIVTTNNNDGSVISSVSIGGSSGTVYQDSRSTTTAALAYRNVAAGSHNITVNMNTSEDRCLIGVWLLTGSSAVDASDTGVGTSATSVQWSQTLASGSILLLVNGHANTNATTWSSATEDDDISVESHRAAWATLSGTSGSHTETVSWSSAASAVVVGRSWV